MKFVLAAAAAAVAAAASPAAALSLRYVGLQTVPAATDFAGTRVGGLSGIDYDAATERYTVISDDRSQFAPARFYDFDLDYTASGFTAATPVATTVIRHPDGTPFPALQIDPEAIRRTPSGTLIWTNEGEATALSQQNPTVREMNADGSYVRDFAVPVKYNPTADSSSGIRNNLAFESLALSPGGTRLFTATEAALYQDGPAATLTGGSAARILAFDTASGAAVSEFVYNIDAVADAPVPEGQFAVSGLVELLALSATDFIAVERSFSVGVGNTIKLYEFSTAGATDVLGFDALAGASYTAVTKTLLLDLGALPLGVPLDNIEGITFGKTLANGRRSLVLVSDNNFGGTQDSQFLAFEVVPEPGVWAMLIAGFGLIGTAMRRRGVPVRA